MPENQPTFRESASWIEGIPLASVRLKIYKLKALNKDLRIYFNSLVKPPIDSVLLVSFYLIASFIPSLVLSFFSSLIFSKKDQQLPRSGFIFNQQDINDIQIILKLV
jgi:hypothetical protein